MNNKIKTMDRPPKHEFLEAMVGRAPLLDSLVDGLSDRSTLEATLSRSRSTINRWLVELLEADVICETNGGYRLTLIGRLAYQEYDRFEKRFSAIYNAKPLLGYLPDDAAIDMRLLVDAEVLLSQEFAPQDPVIRLEDMIRTANTGTFRGITPVILIRFIEFFHDQIVTEGLRAEFVLEATAIDYLLSAFHDEISEIIETDRGTFAGLHDEKVPFGLGVIDGEAVWVGVYESGGGLRGAIINTSPAALEWGQEQFEHYRERAEVVEPKDLIYRGSIRH